jgi:hypothetical protein
VVALTVFASELSGMLWEKAVAAPVAAHLGGL